MGQTQNYDIPYPECDPPLRKDVADAADLFDLATAADAAYDTVYAQASQQMFNANAARMSMSAAVAGTGSQNVTPFFNTRTIDTTATDAMTDLSAGGITITEPGLYWCATWAECVSATALTARIRLNFGSTPVTNFQTPGFVSTGTSAFPACVGVLSVSTAGTILRASIRHSAAAATVWTYQARICTLQLEAY